MSERKGHPEESGPSNARAVEPHGDGTPARGRDPAITEDAFMAPGGVEPAFIAPTAEAPLTAGSPSDAEARNSVFRRVEELVESGEKAKAKAPSKKLILAVGSPLALLAYLAVAGRSNPPRPPPTSLIARAERESAFPDVPKPLSNPPLRIEPDVPLPPPSSVQGSSRATEPGDPGASAPAPDDPGINREAPGAGGDRSKAPPAGEKPSPSEPEEAPEPDWLRRSRPIRAAPPPATGNRPLGIPTGAHIPVRLLTMLDSKTVGNGPVEVKLPRAFLVRGEVILPPGTLMYGQASASDGRFTVRFVKVRLPNDREVDFAGLAMDREDGRAGLAAARRLDAAPSRGEKLGTTVATNTAGFMLGSLTGGLAQDVARVAGQAALSHEDATPAPSAESLLLDPGLLFDVWVEHPF